MVVFKNAMRAFEAIARMGASKKRKRKIVIMDLDKIEYLDLVKSQKNIVSMFTKLKDTTRENDRKVNYKLGKNRVKNLGISIPEKYNKSAQSNGLVEIGIRSILLRLRFDGWNNKSLNEVYDDNNFESVSAQAIESSLSVGVGFISVGYGDSEVGDPKIMLAVENPNEVFAVYDRQRRRVIRAVKLLHVDDEIVEGYYFQEGTGIREFSMTNTQGDEYNFNYVGEWADTSLKGNRVPIFAIPNNQSFDGKIGHSEISEQWISIVDSQTRTMLAYELAREFSLFPKQVFFGISPDDAIDEGLSTMIDRYNLIGDDKASVTELSTADMQSLTTMIATYNRAFAQVSDLPESFFGLASEANPTSAESKTIAENGLINKCTSKIDRLKGDFSNIGKAIAEMLGEEFEMEEGLNLQQSTIANFRDPSTPNRAALSAWVVSLVTAGILDPSAQSTLQSLGLDRGQIEIIQRESTLGSARGLLESLQLEGVNPDETTAGE